MRRAKENSKSSKSSESSRKNLLHYLVKSPYKLIRMKETFKNIQYPISLAIYWFIVTITYPALALYLLGLTIFYFYHRKITPLGFLPLCIVPYIVDPNSPVQLGITRVIMIGFLLVLCYPALKTFFDKTHKEKLPINLPIFISATSLAYCLTVITSCVRLHQNFSTGMWDLAVFDNVFYNMISGNGMANPFERTRNDISHFYIHFSPSLFLLAPLYNLAPRAEALPAIQSLMVPIGALSIYFLGKKLSNPKTGFIVAMGWIFYHPMQGGLFFHFHEIAFAPALMLALGATMVYKQKLSPWIIFIVLLGLKEDFGIIAIPAILLFGYWSKRWKTAITMSILAAAYIGCVKYFFTIPYGEDWTPYYNNLGTEGVKGIISTIITNPSAILEKGIYSEKNFRGLLEILTPIAFLCLASPYGWILLMGPGLILYSAHQTTLASTHMQYPFYIAGFVFLGVLEVLRRTRNTNAKLALLILAIALTQWCFGIINPQNTITSNANKFKVPAPEVNYEKYNDLVNIVSKWDKGTSVMAENIISPHISNRPIAYSIEIANMEQEDWQQKNSLGKKYSELPDQEKPDKIILFKRSPLSSLVDPIMYKKELETQYFETYTKRE